MPPDRKGDAAAAGPPPKEIEAGARFDVVTPPFASAVRPSSVPKSVRIVPRQRIVRSAARLLPHRP